MIVFIHAGKCNVVSEKLLRLYLTQLMNLCYVLMLSAYLFMLCAYLLMLCAYYCYFYKSVK